MTNKKIIKQNNSIVVYQAESGAIELKADFNSETIWATSVQIAEMFSVNPQAISKHIANIYNEEELLRNATSSKVELVQIEGNREVKRSVNIYNLDTIIAIGYRINSKTGTKFRQWATKTLRSHIVDGYTINQSRIKQNKESFLKAVSDVQKLLSKNTQLKTNDVLNLIKSFSDTWFSLDSYDKSSLPIEGANKQEVDFSAIDLSEAILKLKQDLMVKDQATALFAQEKNQGSLSGIVGNVFQSFAGEDLYPSIEEKAAHLLYFIIKNHPFNDGNKRSGAFSFIWFLQKSGVLTTSNLTPDTLTILTLLIAESDPKEKDRILGLVLLLLRKK